MKPENSALRQAPRWVHGSPEPDVAPGTFSNRLVIFTRYPRPGETKTRLIPVLGPEGAAHLHRRMTEHTISWARRLKSLFPVSVEVWYQGEDEASFRKWLGPDILLRPQRFGNLGVRMARAFEQAGGDGSQRGILVGTDIPDLNERLVQKAFEMLPDNDLVLGPAKDGGYYLIGLCRPVEQLFEGIPWGTDQVLEKTLQIATDLQLRVFLLDPLEDVDRPEDLPVWEKMAAMKFLPPSPSRGGGKSPGESQSSTRPNLRPGCPYREELISIIIPTLNEEKNIAACLASTERAFNVERIVVDGGSRDRTREIALSCGVKVLGAPTGRAQQMNAGARSAAGDLLLFLHADTRLPEGFADTVRYTLTLQGIAAGAFEFRLDATSPGLRFIERLANWRSRCLQLPYGDQAIFIRSALFREMGGYRDMPIMEDYEFIQRLKKRGRIYTAPYPAVTSARRWKELGTWKTTMINEMTVVAYYMGLSPTRIHRWSRQKCRPKSFQTRP